ncbi:MAG: protein kinase [Proteobacteria bacterium]|nr:protein kinase [Pseudomonadota bacterium]
MNGKSTRNSLLPGYKLHWYEIKSVLGQGGFGITYLATDLNLHRDVAIKEYLPIELAVREDDSSVHPVSETQSHQYNWGLERFITEARILAKFRHPNIVLVQAVFEENNTGYIIMQYEHGQSLRQKLEDKKTMEESELLGIVLPVLDGLELVHNAGFIHRDLKPDNIFIQTDGNPILLDFGSARQALGDRPKTLTSMISPGYAPYEQYHSKSDEQGPWTDIYGLGATLYRAIAGVSPQSAIDRSKAILETSLDIYVPAVEIGKDRYSEAFLGAIDHAVQFNYKDRPQSVAEWRREFETSAITSTPRLSVLPTERRTLPGTDLRSQKTLSKKTLTLLTILILLAVIGLFDYSNDVVINKYIISLLDHKTENIAEQTAEEAKQIRQDLDKERRAKEALIKQKKLKEIARLLQAAHEDFKMGRFLKPADRNALEKYSNILEIDPDNHDAINGKQQISNHFLDSAEQAINDQAFYQAGDYLNQAELAGPDSVRVKLVRAQLLEERTRQERLSLDKEKKKLQQQREYELQNKMQEEEERQRQLALSQKLEQEVRERSEQERIRQKEYKREVETKRREEEQHQQQELEKKASYNRSLYEAQQALNINNLDLALLKYEQSLQIFPASKEALEGQRRVQAIQSICQRVLGEWLWFNGGLTTFYADGTVTGEHRILPGNNGSWECADPAKRRFIIKWNQGGWINKLTLSGDGKRLDGTNQEGSAVSGRRKK